MSTPIESFFQRFFENQTDIFEYPNTIVLNPEDVYATLQSSFKEINYVCLREDQKNSNCINTSIIDFLDQPLEQNTNLIIILPKAKKLTEIIMHWLTQQDLSKTHLWVFGENDLGAKSFDNFAKKYNFECQLLDNARRCRAFEMYPIKQSDQKFSLEKYVKSFQHKDKTLMSLPGVFSHGHIDKGTEVLLNFLDKNNLPIKGKILDFACGCGIIAQYLTKYSKDIHAIDTDYFAIHCSKLSNPLNKSDINFIQSNGLPNNSNIQYDWIISNPPFHENKRTNYSITESFILESKNHLKQNGSLLLVVNDFLDYESTISTVFSNLEVLYSSKGFKIIKANN